MQISRQVEKTATIDRAHKAIADILSAHGKESKRFGAPLSIPSLDQAGPDPLTLIMCEGPGEVGQVKYEDTLELNQRFSGDRKPMVPSVSSIGVPSVRIICEPTISSNGLQIR